MAQRYGHRTVHHLERLRHAGLALKHVDDMQPEAAVHEARKDPDLGVTEQLARELGRYEFLITWAPLPVEGGSGSPVNPLAMF